MRCPIETPESAGLLLQYCARKLDPGTAAILEDHIGICPACREFAEGQRAVWQALDTWEAPPVSADFDRRLYQRIDQSVSWWDRMMRPVRPVFHHGLPITAAAAVLIVAGVLLERPSGVAPAMRPDSAQVETVAPDQADHVLEDMEMIRKFSEIMRPESAGPRM